MQLSNRPITIFYWCVVRRPLHFSRRRRRLKLFPFPALAATLFSSLCICRQLHFQLQLSLFSAQSHNGHHSLIYFITELLIPIRYCYISRIVPPLQSSLTPAPATRNIFCHEYFSHNFVSILTNVCSCC